MLLEFGKANPLEKARKQPDKVRMVLDKVRTDGLLTTYEAVRNKLDQPLPMGYCNVGRVVELGPGVRNFSVGERVASNGSHAELVAVPVNLCAKIPDAVSDEQAAFTVLGAIALQGIRLVRPSLGETVVVTGLGLIGLLTVQLLRANGCRVLGLDFDASKVELARKFGAEAIQVGDGIDPLLGAEHFSRGRGVDAVIITAATQSSEPVRQAAQMCRKRGRIILVGVTGLDLSRADFYEKELTFQVSCSYGPGRYDPEYEVKGHDYPLGFVRWTEQRNFEAVLDMMADGRLDLAPLLSHRFAIDEAERAYEVVGGAEPSLGILLKYPTVPESERSHCYGRTVALPPPSIKSTAGMPRVSFIGAGNYAGAILVPAFAAAGAKLEQIASSGGLSGVHIGTKHGFAKATTDTVSLLGDTQTDLVVITTRHNSHADLVIRALEAGKHVFVEKPLALSLSELAAIEIAHENHPNQLIMVGFNRRFAPHVVRMKELLSSTCGEKSLVMTVNAGALPADHWALDPAVGGGRLVGEGCHFVDLLRFLAGSPIREFQCVRSGKASDTGLMQFAFENGDVGSVQYLTSGSKLFPKERLEVFVDGRVLRLDNFRQLTGFGWPGFKQMTKLRQDKGQGACAAATLRAVSVGGTSPIPWSELYEVSRVSIELEATGR